MKHIIEFDPSRELIFVPGVVQGPHRETNLELLFREGKLVIEADRP